jgi:uncharacterized protein (TIGR02466 family)
MAKFINVFALSIYRDHIELEDAYRKRLVDLVLELESADGSGKPEHSAWLGDTGGSEFLFQHEEFKELHRLIGEKIRLYAEGLGVDSEMIDFYYQRSWATVSREGERINEHAHEQSNISFAYYLKMPVGGGGINFVTYSHPNEFSPGIFTPAKASMGFIKNPGLQTWNNVTIDPKEGDIFVFPSKTLHSTNPNPQADTRISISADVTTMLRDSQGHETMMPHFSQWEKIGE